LEYDDEKISQPELKEAAGQWRDFNDKKFHVLYSFQNSLCNQLKEE
jgi:hypothetical protein